MDKLAERDKQADATTKSAARSQVIPTIASLIWDACITQEKPHYSTEEKQWV